MLVHTSKANREGVEDARCGKAVGEIIIMRGIVACPAHVRNKGREQKEGTLRG